MDDYLAQSAKWLDWYETVEPFSLALVGGNGEDEVIRRLGGDPAETRQLSAGQASALVGQEYPGHAAVRLRTIGKVVFVLVHSRRMKLDHPEFALPLSRSGRCFAVNMDFGHCGYHGATYAVDGEVVLSSSLEPYEPVVPFEPGDPRWNPMWGTGLGFAESPDGQDILDTLTLIQRTMGAVLEPVWWSAAPLRTALIRLPDGSVSAASSSTSKNEFCASSSAVRN